MILLSTSPCVAVLRSSERTLGARFPEGATRRAPNDAAPTEPAPVDPYRGAVTAPAKNTYVTFLLLFIRKSRWKDWWILLCFGIHYYLNTSSMWSVWNSLEISTWSSLLLKLFIDAINTSFGSFWVVCLPGKKCSLFLLGDFPDVG